MKRPARYPLTEKERKKCKGWVIYYVPKSGKIVYMEKIAAKDRNEKKIRELFERHHELAFELIK